jgi:hypothetical protein
VEEIEMEIRESIALKHWLQAAIEEMATEYESQGYAIQRDILKGDYRIDLMARKGDHTVICEFKTKTTSEKQLKLLRRIRNAAVHEWGYDFKLVWVTLPREKEIEVVDIEILLHSYFVEDTPSELDPLSTHTRVDEVSDVDIDHTEITKDGIQLKGTGMIGVELQYGSNGDMDRDNGMKEDDSFPFTFEARLSFDFKLEDVIAEVDTRSFYNGE